VTRPAPIDWLWWPSPDRVDNKCGTIEEPAKNHTMTDTPKDAPETTDDPAGQNGSGDADQSSTTKNSEERDWYPPEYHVAGQALKITGILSAVVAVVVVGPLIFTFVAKFFDPSWTYYFNPFVTAGIPILGLAAAIIWLYRRRLDQIYGNRVSLSLQESLTARVEAVSLQGQKQTILSTARVVLWFDSEAVRDLAEQKADTIVPAIRRIFANSLKEADGRILQAELEKQILENFNVPNLVYVELKDLRHQIGAPAAGSKTAKTGTKAATA
jgi:hypothetical protein